MYLVLGRFFESIEGIQILQLHGHEDEKDNNSEEDFLHRILKNHPVLSGMTYLNAEQFSYLPNEPYFWDVGEAIILKGEVVSLKLEKKKGEGQNILGIFLMETRETLRKEKEKNEKRE